MLPHFKLPVVEFVGTSYEIGFQHGKTFKLNIEFNYKKQGSNFIL